MELATAKQNSRMWIVEETLRKVLMITNGPLVNKFLFKIWIMFFN